MVLDSADVSGAYYDWSRTLKPEAPWRHDYSQTLVMKLFLCSRGSDGGVKRVTLTFQDALETIKRIDAATLQVPKIAYLVGWQFNGHDSKYPSWAEVNPALRRPQDKTSLQSLKWLMREAKRYHTTVSLHVNMIDAYEDSPLWPDYLARDVIAKDKAGKPIPGETFDGVQSYQISYAQEWKLGLAQARIDGLIKMLPELKQAGTIHLDAFHSMRPSGVSEPISPHLGLTLEQEVEAQRKVFRLFRKHGIDVTCEGGMYWLRRDPFIGLQPMAWHFRAENFVNEDWIGKPSGFQGLPPSLYCGTPFNIEPIVMQDPVALPGLVRNVCMHLAPWFLANRTPKSEGLNEVVEDRAVFCPAPWQKSLVLAYSDKGFEGREFRLPEDWNSAESVQVNRLTLEGEVFKEVLPVRQGAVALTSSPAEAMSIRPTER